MTTFQAVAIVTVGTLMFQIADIGKSVYVRSRDIAESHQPKHPAEIDRLAKDHAFLHHNSNHTPPSDISPIDPQSTSIK